MKKLIEILGEGLKIGTISMALSCSLGLSESNSYVPESKPVVNEEVLPSENVYLPFKLPDKLTQDIPDFYKDPRKDFIVYHNVYRKLTEDGVIDFRDVNTLRYVLQRTIIEAESKINKNNGNLKDSISNNLEAKSYFEYLLNLKSDLEEFDIHLDTMKKWIESDMVKGNFWNFGTGLSCNIPYYRESIDGNNRKNDYRKGLKKVFSQNPIYKTNYEILLNSIKVPKINYPYEDFPIKLKFNYWLGLLVGVTPAGLSFLSLYRKDIRGKELDEVDLLSFTFGVCNSLFGFVVFDSVHPIVYPARIAIPAVYEGYQWIFRKRDLSIEDKEILKPSTAELEEKVETPEINPDFKVKVEDNEIKSKPEDRIINPWDYDPRQIEDKVEDEQVGNDNPAEKIINPWDYDPRQIEERMIYDGGVER